MHIDDWFTRYRKPAYRKIEDGDDQWFKTHKLFCVYQDKQYRTTGCSRLGDIRLTSDFNQTIGYELRVDFSECSLWTK